MTAIPTSRFVARVEGFVQGVGFRFFVQARARELGLAGSVRNLPTGSVQVDAEGPRKALDALIRDLHQGPTTARVERVVVEWQEPRGAARFVISPG